VNWLTIILGFTATVTVVGFLAILTWLLYTGHLAGQSVVWPSGRGFTAKW
jgi:hypothetical protein